ncbi:MAG TPA: circadian clock protein KaiC [Actinomycetota bacterium]|nr:circadian clock protein KaiC [Actinomycetota bacterium]
MIDEEVARLSAEIEGLDVISHGGLPRGRLTLVTGTSGSGKTIFATQFLAAGAKAGEPGVFVSFEERPSRIRSDVRAFGWDIARWEEEGSFCFVDASTDFADATQYSGRFDLAPLVARVNKAVDSVGAKRVAMDSIGALINQFEDAAPARRALFEIAASLADAGVTTVMTAERPEDYGPVAHHGFEDFVADAVILLRNTLTGEKRRRTVEVLKIRGGSHAKGEHLFTIRRGGGIVIVPNAAIAFDYDSSTDRVTSGNGVLDEMLHGGLFTGSLILVSGPTGTGKSLLATQFVAGGALSGERVLFNSFEESAQQIARNAKQSGIDFDGLSSDGRLRILADPPEAMALEDHLLRIKETVESFEPTRVVIDSLTALERISTIKSFREYVLGLAFYLKKRGILGLFTATSGRADEAATLTDLHVSTITDTILVLQYVAVGSRLSRGINVLKARGSDHDKSLREFRITGEGLHIGDAFGSVAGAWTGVTARADGEGRP